MQKKLLLNALIVIALLTFPAATFASSPSEAQTTGSDLQAELTLTPSDQAITTGDSIDINLTITNIGPEAAFYDHESFFIPVAEFFVPPSVTIDSLELPDGIACINAPVGDLAGPVVGAAFPGYVLILCNIDDDTVDLTFAPEQSLNFIVHGTANADVPDNTRFLGLGISAQDPAFGALFTAIMNGEDPFSAITEDDNFVADLNYSIPEVTTTSVPETTTPETTTPEVHSVLDASATGTLTPSATLIHAGDPVRYDFVIHNSGPHDAIDTQGNGNFFQIFLPPELSIDVDPDTHLTTSIGGIDGMTCYGGLLSEQMTGTAIDLAHPGFSGFACYTPATPGFQILNGENVTITVNGTASTDFVDGVTTAYGVVLIGDDPDLEQLGAAFMANEDPLALDNNNIARVGYSVNVPTTTIPSEVKGEQETNTAGKASASGVLSSTGAKVVTLFVIGLVLLGCGVAMVAVSRKKESEPAGQ